MALCSWDWLLSILARERSGKTKPVRPQRTLVKIGQIIGSEANFSQHVFLLVVIQEGGSSIDCIIIIFSVSFWNFNFDFL